MRRFSSLATRPAHTRKLNQGHYTSPGERVQTMATHASQTNTNHEQLVHALNELDYSLQELKNADAWCDRADATDALCGREPIVDRDLYKRVASNAVSMYAQQVVDLSRNG